MTVSLYSALAQNERGFKLLLAALCLFTAFLFFLVMQHQEGTWRRWLLLVPEYAGHGEHVYRAKGCVHCHAVAGVGGKTGPDFAATAPQQARLPQLVVAMWNHVPRMRDRMEAEHLTYPDLSYDESAQLIAFLYSLSRLDRIGNLEHGHQVFVQKGCVRCHGRSENDAGKHAADLTKLKLPDKLAWAQAMLTHAPRMQQAMDELGMPWPQFGRTELNDLISYLQRASGQPGKAATPLPGDPDAGWQVYQSKSCLVCHSVRDNDTGIAPSLGPATALPSSATGIAAVMWNHMPNMRREIQERHLRGFAFQGQELADLIAFIQNLRYFEPTGSPQVGQTVFRERGCANCHGSSAEGGNVARGLRRPGRIYNSISLATALWRHGGAMYRQNQQMRLDWPTLQESDVGDLLAFLNKPVAKESR